MAVTKEILTLAVETGDALLRNGAEVYRVEDTVLHILKAYEITDCDVYVLSNGIFAKFYQQITGTESNGITELEICYSIGLAVGIIVFFNHVGHKKITHDPTPIQIEMRKYETDLDTAFINNAERRGHSVDVD